MSEPTPAPQPELPVIETLNLSVDESLTPIEQFYDILRRNTNDEKLNTHLIEYYKNLQVNEVLKNGDTLLCFSCNKGLEKVVKSLVEHYEANVNLCRNVNVTGSGFSSVSSSITISSRRQSRLINSSISSAHKAAPKGDSPLTICIKYGIESIGVYLIEFGADITGGDPDSDPIIAEFERSPLQDAIRLNRNKIIEKLFQTMFEKDDLKTIEWIISKRYDILRQVLMADNLETLKVILPNIIESRRIDGEMLIHILNYLLMKSKIHEKKEKFTQILETVMEISSVEDESNLPFEIYNFDVFVRGFLATLKALFNVVSSDDKRSATLNYRATLFFFIIKYSKALINFEEFYPDIDSAFELFYTKMKDTGENVLKLVEFFITFYDTLITMGHIHLSTANVTNVLRLEHVKKLDILGDYLIQRSITPMDLKELARLKIKESMTTYNLYNINSLAILDQSCKDYLYFV